MKSVIFTFIVVLLAFNTADANAQTKLVASRTAINSPVNIVRVSSTGEVFTYKKTEKSVEDYAMDLTTIMSVQLDMTPEQDSKVYDINVKTTKQLEELKDLRTSDKTNYVGKVKALAELHNASLASVLTTDQFQSYVEKSKS
ncbi:MAG: hypothetical protein ACPGXL_03840 [Chitinophagales bacterium]